MGSVNPFSGQIQYKMQPFLFWLWLAAIVPHISEIPTWTSIVAFIIGAWAWLSLHQKMRLMPKAFLALLSPTCGFFVYREFHTLLGPEAATPLLLLLASLKLHEIHKRRDVVVFLFITLLCVMYYLLASQTLLATVYMIGMTLAVAVSFIVIHTPPEKLREVLRSSPRLVGKDVLLAMPIFLAFFFLFPRFSTPWGQFLTSPQTVTGFADSMQPGDMAKLSRSQDPAFRVTFTIDKSPKLSQLYWRGTVLDRTTGWRWLRSAHNDVATPAVKRDESNSSLEYKITLEAKYDKTIFSLDKTPELHWVHDDSHNPIFRQTDYVFQTTWPNVTRVQYQGFIPLKSDKEILEPSQFEFYTRLPHGFSARVRELAEKLTAGATTAEEKSDRIMSFFSDGGFQYSLVTPQMDTLDKFLFDDKVGFCEHFASAYAALMRAAHVPSRIIMGFQGGEYNEYSDYLLVRDSHAHAWAEIYSTDSGWVRKDPTAAVNTNRILLGSNSVAGTTNHDWLAKAYYSGQMFWDSVNNRYTKFLMNYDFNEQKDIFGLSSSLTVKRYQFFLVLILFIAILFYVTQKLVRRTAKKVDPAAMLYNELCAHLSKRGIQRNEVEGPLHFANRVIEKIPDREDVLSNLFVQIIQWRYHDRVPSRSDTTAFRKNLKTI
jgi:protein-glutamine gamma-glutamyltransferase